MSLWDGEPVKKDLERFEGTYLRPTLLDQFAMAALTGLIQNASHTSIGFAVTAEKAYSLAQAMMKAREAQG